VFLFSVVIIIIKLIMALEQITGLKFQDKQMLLDADESLCTDIRGAMYNSTHFEIPRTFDVSIAIITGPRVKCGCAIHGSCIFFRHIYARTTYNIKK